MHVDELTNTKHKKNKNSTSKGAKCIQKAILGCDNCFIFHWGNGHLNWCWNSWMNLYINILNILWECVTEFEMNLMNMEDPKSLLNIVTNVFVLLVN
jgi:hypothetical protein